MTVEELIKHLEILPSETQVLVEGYETGYDDIVALKSIEVIRYRNAQEWDGEYQAQSEFPAKGGETFPVAVIVGRRGYLR